MYPHFGTTLTAPPQKNLDGIIYRSAQTNKAQRNVALFHHASKIEPLDIPADAVVTTQSYTATEEGDEIDYGVCEEVAPATATVPPGPLLSPGQNDDRDTREPTLRLDVKTIEVRHVEAVSFEAQSYEVSRHRRQKRDREDF
jgi:hypothetical protein